MSTLADYVGRTVDLLAFGPPAGGYIPGTDQLLAQSFVGAGAGGGAVVTGVEKLAQRVLLTLLTRAGTLAFQPALGTTFLDDAQSGQWRTEADVELSFYAAKLDLVRQVQGMQTAADPPDEQLVTVDLDSATLAGTHVTLHLTLVTAAGTGRTFLAPIPVVTRP